VKEEFKSMKQEDETEQVAQIFVNLGAEKTMACKWPVN